MYIRLFRSSFIQFWSSIDLSHSIWWRSNFLFYSSTGGFLCPSSQRKKQYNTLWLKWVSCVRCYEPRISVRQRAAMSHCDLNFSSAVRCYEPLWSEYWNDRSCWLVWHVYQKHCTLCICNCTENQTFCTSLPAFPSNSTERETCCKFACISICKSTDWGLACILHALAFARVLACVHFQATVLRDRHVCKSTERQTFA